ncbi:MAG: nodulation protein NfeD [Candidatus Binatia bacterium]
MFGKISKRYFKSCGPLLYKGGALLALLIVGGFPVIVQPQDPSSPHVNLIVVDGGINPAVDDFIRENIRRAHATGARALIIQLDTPGGLLTSTRSIVKEILGAPVPVVVYVAPSGAGAGSAGVFITLASHIAAMAPGTNIGAAHPVAGGGQEVKGVMGEKIENFTASFSETIAQRRGRNTEFAIQAVRRSVSITEKEALEKNVIDVVAKDLDDLLRQADGRKVEINGRKQMVSLKGVRVERVEMGLKQKIINILSDPNIAYLLLMAGILGLYMEFSNPGVIFPGVAGGIALLLALTSFQILPINYAGLALILLGIALLVGEAFLPSFGVLGIGGAISLGLGSLLLFDTQTSDLVLDRAIVFTAVGTLSAFIMVVGYLVVKAHKRKPTLGMEGLVGEVGEVKVKLDPAGKIFVHGEYWNAEGDGEIEIGEKIRVVGFDGMCLKVERLLESPQRS